MNMFKNGRLKFILKRIVIYLILVFIFISCVILSFPSARYDIVNLFTTGKLKTGISGGPDPDPKIPHNFGTENQGTW